MCLLNGFSQRNAPNDAWCPPYDARDASCHARDASRVRVNRIGIVLFVKGLWLIHDYCIKKSFLLFLTNSMMPMRGMMPPTHGMPPMMPGMPPGKGTFHLVTYETNILFIFL